MTAHFRAIDFAIDASDVANAVPILERYDIVARLLHWTFAVGIIFASVVGYSLSFMEKGPLREDFAHLNMSIATVLIVLLPLRLLWRIVRTEPEPPQELSAANLRIAHAAHALLYALMSIVLVSGYLMVPHGYRFFGVATIRTPFEQGSETAAFFLVHRISCASLAAMVLLHLAGVVAHTLIRPTGLLRRML